LLAAGNAEEGAKSRARRREDSLSTSVLKASVWSTASARNAMLTSGNRPDVLAADDEGSARASVPALRATCRTADADSNKSKS
jgi:phage-related tail fiber protein